MRIAGEVLQDVLRPAERRFGVDDPLCLLGFPQPGMESSGLGEIGYRSSAPPTSCGSGSRTWYRPFPVTCNVPLSQSMSPRRRAATSPERNPSRANISKIARSRTLPRVVPLDATINRVTYSADKQCGSLASRQCATAGIATARSSRHSPRKLRNRRNARRDVISACVVDVPLWLACSRRKFRTVCAFHWPTSLPSARTKSVTPRA